jgi:hypothetical protein
LWLLQTFLLPGCARGAGWRGCGGVTGGGAWMGRDEGAGDELLEVRARAFLGGHFAMGVPCAHSVEGVGLGVYWGDE